MGEPFPSSEADWIGSDNSGPQEVSRAGLHEALHFTREMKTASHTRPFSQSYCHPGRVVTKKIEFRQLAFFPSGSESLFRDSIHQVVALATSEGLATAALGCAMTLWWVLEL